MSEIPTTCSLIFIQFNFVLFPDSSDFGHYFLFEIPNSKNPNGTKSLDFRQEKVSEIWTFVFWLRTLFYLHTSDKLMPSTYSVRLNVGVSKHNKKACCKPFRSQLERLDFRHFLKSEHPEIWTFCVSQKSWMSKIW